MVAIVCYGHITCYSTPISSYKFLYISSTDEPKFHGMKDLLSGDHAALIRLNFALILRHSTSNDTFISFQVSTVFGSSAFFV